MYTSGVHRVCTPSDADNCEFGKSLIVSPRLQTCMMIHYTERVHKLKTYTFRNDVSQCHCSIYETVGKNKIKLKIRQ